MQKNYLSVIDIKKLENNNSTLLDNITLRTV